MSIYRVVSHLLISVLISVIVPSYSTYPSFIFKHERSLLVSIYEDFPIQMRIFHGFLDFRAAEVGGRLMPHYDRMHRPAVTSVQKTNLLCVNTKISHQKYNKYEYYL